MFIRSERLFLRPGWPEDDEELLRLIGDEPVPGNVAKLRGSERPIGMRSSSMQAQDRRNPHFFVTVPSAQGSKLVGACGITANQGSHPELGFLIARGERGKGYATEAGRAVLRLARTLGHRSILAHQFSDHPASDRVLRKLGFAPNGEISPRYCVARREFVPAIVYSYTLGAPGDCDNGIGSAASGEPDGSDADRSSDGMRAA